MRAYFLLALFSSTVCVNAQEVDHSKMDHSKMDHSKMDHSKMDHSKMAPPETSKAEPLAPITTLPEPSEADLAAAFPVLQSAHAHDAHWMYKANIDQLEWTDADFSWEASFSIANDTSRFLLRSSGEQSHGQLQHSNIDVLFARGISPWWEAVIGANQFKVHGARQEFLAFGFIGMAPYKFEVEATAFLANSGQSRLQLAVEYQTLLSQRFILEPKLEAEFYGRSNQLLGWGSGLGEMEAGLRLRYEISRQFAPYVGVVHSRYFGKTADLMQTAGEASTRTEWVLGLRAWF